MKHYKEQKLKQDLKIMNSKVQRKKYYKIAKPTSQSDSTSAPRYVWIDNTRKSEFKDGY